MPNNNYRSSRSNRSRTTRTKSEADMPKAVRKMKQQANREREQYYKKNNRAKGKRSKGRKKKSKHPKLALTAKIFVIMFLLLCIIMAGIIAGTFFGLFGDDFSIEKEDLIIAASDSVILDQQGNKIADLSGDEKRKIITLNEMAEYLPKAYVAIEDERFYSHHGVDLKRTGGAIVNTLFKGDSSYGGSTITQQLVKNLTNDKESSGVKGIMRKIKEWVKAYQVERLISKPQILELYLNILFVGGSNNMHGVELGAEYYFGKTAKELDLAECAFLAGINNQPNAYNPYDGKDHTEQIKKRTKTVLSKMKELGYINSEEEYNAAVAKVDAGLPFQQMQSTTSAVYSYHTDAVIQQLVDQVMEERNIPKELAENYVYGSGLKIYSTVDANIQARLEEEYKKEKYVKSGRQKKDGKLINDHTQSGMAIIDYKTGNVVGVAGGFGEKTEARGWNRATQARKQTGSSMKPLAAVAPALEEKIITAATVYNDAATDFGGGYTPKNYNGFKGTVNIRQFIETSQNIPALKIMAELTPSKSIEYLHKMGMNNLVDDPNQDAVLSLAIGGMQNCITPLEMAAGYGMIANDGTYITPTFYTKVENKDGEVIMTPKQEKTKVISEQNAYIMKSILQEPVNGANGTAKYCAMQGIDVAAKTGTTNDDVDRWLCGFTPYYSAACWYGYDNNEKVIYSAGNPAGLIWDAVMTDIHKDLPNAKFTRPSGIVEDTACRASGCIASSGCGDTYTEIFTADNKPTSCNGHGSQKICTESGLVATAYCPSTRTNYYGSSLPKEQLKLWKPLGGSASSGSKVTGVCNIHTAPTKSKEEEATPKPQETTKPKAESTPKPQATPAATAKPSEEKPTDPTPAAGAGGGGTP